MPTVLEETTSLDIDRAQIERRVEDWVSRIDGLYQQVAQWLPREWETQRAGTIQMREELMQKYGVEPRELPVLKLSYQGQISARIEPRVLWIIGANGRCRRRSTGFLPNSVSAAKIVDFVRDGDVGSEIDHKSNDGAH